MSRKRTVCYIPGTDYVEGRGYRVAFVTEGEDGYYPTGTWPYTGEAGTTMPWFAGPTLQDAYRFADETNERLGITKIDALRIVAESMGLARATAKRR